MKTIAEIRALRKPLVAEATRQRGTIALQFASLQGPADAVARGLDVFDWLRRHPLAVGAAVAVLVVVQPRRALRLAGRGVVLWRSLRMLKGWLREIGVTSCKIMPGPS